MQACSAAELLTSSSLRLQVADTGIGIPDSEKSKVFEPFAKIGQLSAPGRGAGLGLWNVKLKAEAMSGWVEISDNFPHGMSHLSGCTLAVGSALICMFAGLSARHMRVGLPSASVSGRPAVVHES